MQNYSYKIWGRVLQLRDKALRNSLSQNELSLKKFFTLVLHFSTHYLYFNLSYILTTICAAVHCTHNLKKKKTWKREVHESKKKQHFVWAREEKLQRGFSLDPGLFVFHIRTSPAVFAARIRALPCHLQASFPLLVFRVHLGKLGLNPTWVNVGVEIGHDGKDDAHHHQQGSKEDVLSPLVRKHTKEGFQNTFSLLMFP